MSQQLRSTLLGRLTAPTRLKLSLSATVAQAGSLSLGAMMQIKWIFFAENQAFFLCMRIFISPVQMGGQTVALLCGEMLILHF